MTGIAYMNYITQGVQYDNDIDIIIYSITEQFLKISPFCWVAYFPNTDCIITYSNKLFDFFNQLFSFFPLLCFFLFLPNNNCIFWCSTILLANLSRKMLYIIIMLYIFSIMKMPYCIFALMSMLTVNNNISFDVCRQRWFSVAF